MVKCAICIVSAVILVLINTIILFLKPSYEFAENDLENYTVYYEKWLSSIVFMATLIAFLFSTYYAINLNIIVSLIVLCIECLLVIIYALVKYKGVTVNKDEILVSRLFRQDVTITFDNISKVLYYPNARMVVSLKNKDYFDISLNSINFYKFYQDLIKRNVKFKTANIPFDQDHVFLSKYNITISFPDKMFREYYENERYFRNSKYLFSARNLEANEYIEGYCKDSGKDVDEFIDLVKNDLKINDFKVVDTDKVVINSYDFVIIKALDSKDDERARLAYIYQDVNNYFVIYADYYLKNEETFAKKMEKAIKRSEFSESKESSINI